MSFNYSPLTKYNSDISELFTIKPTINELQEDSIEHNTNINTNNNPLNPLELPLPKEEVQTIKDPLQKALVASNLPMTERNLSIVMELINHQMPIDKNTLQSLHKLSIDHQETSAQTLVLMFKNKIPISTNNIRQFESYQQGTHQLLGLIHKISHNITQVENLPKLITQSTLDISEIQNLVTSPEDIKVIREILSHQWKLPLKNLPKKNAVRDLYRVLEEDINTLNDIVEKTSKSPEDSLLKEPIKEAQDNLQFIKDLNQIIQYIQLPIASKNKDIHVDLYVLDNKKALLDKKDNLTILIHLEMPNLGQINIRMISWQNQIQAGFQLNDSKASEIIEKHLPELSKSLAKKGYYFKGFIDKSGNHENIFKEVFNRDGSQENSTSLRYSFDMRI